MLLNESEYLKGARQLATNVLAEKGLDDGQRVDVLYETITAYELSQSNRDSLIKLLADLKTSYSQATDLAADLCGETELPNGVITKELAAWTMVASTIYNLDLAKTRQ